MIILIVIGIIFFRRAEGATSNKIMWAILGPVAYYISQFIGILLVGLINPGLLQESILLFIVGVATGLGGVAIVYRIMDKQNPSKKQPRSNSDIIDDAL